MKVLVVYGSTEGQTLRLARFVLGVVREAGRGAHLADADDLYRVGLDDYGAVIVGASVHHGEHQSSVVNFVKDNLELLQHVPTAFFSVSLNTAVDDAECQAEAEGYVRMFLETTGWQPGHVRRVAGALRHTELDYFRRELARHVAARTVGVAHAAGDHDFTDYDDLRQFINEFLSSLKADPTGRA